MTVTYTSNTLRVGTQSTAEFRDKSIRVRSIYQRLFWTFVQPLSYIDVSTFIDVWINSLTSLLIDQSATVHTLRSVFEEAAANLRGAELGPFQRRAKQTFCQACFDGDIDKVLFFLDGLPDFFTWLSKECTNDANAVSWACYGKQTEIVRLISERQDPKTFIGFDFDVALEILDQARDDEAPLKPIDYDQWHGRSTAEVIHKVAIKENDKTLLHVIADVLEKNLDKFFKQIGV